jgi:hypothetical protein
MHLNRQLLELVQGHQDAMRLIAAIRDGAGGVGTQPAGEVLAESGEGEDVEQVVGVPARTIATAARLALYRG